MFPRFRYTPPSSKSSVRESLRVLGTTHVKTGTSTALGLHPFDPVATSNKSDLNGVDRVRTRSGRVMLSVPNPETPQSLRLQAAFASKRAFDTRDSVHNTPCAIPDGVASDSGYLGTLLAPDGYAKFVQIVRAYGGSITRHSADSFTLNHTDIYVVAVERCCTEHAKSFGAQIPPVFALTMPTKAEGILAVRQAWVELLTSWSVDWTVRQVRTRSQLGPHTRFATGMYGSTRAGFPFVATGFAAGGAMLSLAIGYNDRRSGAIAAAITAALSAPALITRSDRSLYDSLALKVQWRRSAMKGHHVIAPRTAEAGTR